MPTEPARRPGGLYGRISPGSPLGWRAYGTARQAGDGHTKEMKHLSFALPGGLLLFLRGIYAATVKRSRPDHDGTRRLAFESSEKRIFVTQVF